MNLIKEESYSTHRRIATIGMFDGVHCGHKLLIDNLCKVAYANSFSPTIVTFSQHPATIINPQTAPKLLMTLDERLQALDNMGVEECILLDFDNEMRLRNAHDFLKMLHGKFGIDALMVGFNNRFGYNRSDGFEQYVTMGKELGMVVYTAPELKNDDGISISASEIRQALLWGKIHDANSALGYKYFINGTVTQGKQLGRKIGFPTANISITTQEKLIPKNGVYAVSIKLEDDYCNYKAMLYIGHRPTVDNTDAPLSIEVHIFGFSKEVYGKGLKIEFVDFIREEHRFSSIEELKRQLATDKETAIRLLLND